MTTATAATLGEYDFIFVIDASASMGTEDMKGRSRWAYMQETLEGTVRDISKLDSDGVGLVVFSGSDISAWDGVDVSKVTEVFSARRPNASTPLAEALTAALKLAGKSDKPDFIIVFTDGTPDDKAAAAKVIVDASKKLEKDEDLTFLFVQVGYDRAATEYLTMLDDNLKGAKFDIVDCKTIEEVEKFSSITDLILAAIDG